MGEREVTSGRVSECPSCVPLGCPRHCQWIGPGPADPTRTGPRDSVVKFGLHSDSDRGDWRFGTRRVPPQVTATPCSWATALAHSGGTRDDADSAQPRGLGPGPLRAHRNAPALARLRGSTRLHCTSPPATCHSLPPVLPLDKLTKVRAHGKHMVSPPPTHPLALARRARAPPETERAKPSRSAPAGSLNCLRGGRIGVARIKGRWQQAARQRRRARRRPGRCHRGRPRRGGRACYA